METDEEVRKNQTRSQIMQQRRCYLAVQSASFRNRSLKSIGDVCAIVRSLHPPIMELGFLALGIFGLYEIVRKLSGH